MSRDADADVVADAGGVRETRVKQRIDIENERQPTGYDGEIEDSGGMIPRGRELTLEGEEEERKRGGMGQQAPPLTKRESGLVFRGG